MENYEMTAQNSLVSYTLLRNDSDLVERFVRHYCGILDGMVFIDDCSTDETVDILDSLRQEGLPVIVLPAENPYTTWEYERQLERVWAETSADFILPLQVNEFLVRDRKKALCGRLIDSLIRSDGNIPCTTAGFPDAVDFLAPSFQKIRARKEALTGLPVTGWKIVGIPPSNAAIYKVKSCVNTLDGIAGRRGDCCSFSLWRNVYEQLKEGLPDEEITLPKADAIWDELGLEWQERQYLPKAKTGEDVVPDILDYCEHFANTYRLRTLQKWPELGDQAQLNEIENQIRTLQGTRSWQLTRPLRKLVTRLRKTVGLRCDEM